MNLVRKFSSKLFALLLSFGLLLLPPAHTVNAATTTYTVADIAQAATVDHTEARGMNSASQIVGYLYQSNGSVHTFVYTDATLHDIDAELGSDYVNFNYNLETGLNTGINANINEQGQLAGVAYTSTAGDMRAVYYDAQGVHVVGTLGGASSYPSAINAAGQLAGYAQTTSGDRHAFLYDATNGIQDLGTLGGAYSDATAINSNGKVVGAAATSDGSEHAFLYSAGVMQDLGTLGGTQSRAYGINTAGQVVGGADTTGGARHAFLYDADGMHDLNPPDSVDSVALAINSNGQVVGYASDMSVGTYVFVHDSNGTHQVSLGGANMEIQYFTDSGIVAGQAYTSTGAYVAFLYDGVTTHALALSDTNYSFLNGVNDAGQAVGTMLNTNYEQHAFLYDADGVHDLVPDSAFSEADGINSAGQLVGLADTPDDVDQYVFSYQNGVMTDLNSATAGSGYELYVPIGVSTDGQIVCNGAVSDSGRALLLTPVP